MLVAATLGLVAGPAGAATFVVSSAAPDAVDSGPGDGVCATAAATCSLRAAIQEANAQPGHDTVSFPPLSVTHVRDVVTVSLAGAGEDGAASGDLDVTDDLTIAGNGARRTIVDGGGLDRVLDLDPAGAGISVEISGVTLRHGTLSGSGGGLRSKGNLVLTKSTLSQNRGTIDGGGLDIDVSTAVATLRNVSLSANRAQRTGGAIMNRGALTLTDITVDGNVADAEGGGMWNSGLARFSGVTISANTAKGGAGGLFAGGLGNGGSANLQNVTISGNTGDPGGLHNGGAARLTNVAIVQNTGGVFNCNACGGTLTAVNTIVADSPFIFNINCYGTLTSLGHNLDTGSSCGFTAPGDISTPNALLGPLANSVGPTRTHALLQGSPAIDAGVNAGCPATDQRGVLRPQGGTCDIGPVEQQRHALIVNSRVDAVDAAPGDGVCRTNVPGQCTLRAAIVEANARAGTDLVRFRIDGRFLLTRAGAGEDAASTGDLDITDDVTIVGRGVGRTVIGGLAARLRDRVFHLHNPPQREVTAAISGMTVERGNLGTGEEGAGVLVGDFVDPATARLVMRAVTVRANALGPLSEGGGIADEGALELTDSEVSANTASLGGGIFVGLAATATTDNVLVTANSATSDGGGVFLAKDSRAELRSGVITANTADLNGGGIVNHGAVTIAGESVSNNALNDPTSVGGGVWNGGSLAIIDTQVIGNTASRWGGGLWNDVSASLSLAASTVRANTAAVGGGAYNNEGTLTVDRSTLSHNDAAGFGGGALNNNGATMAVTNSTLSTNSSASAGGAVRNGLGGTVSLSSATLSANDAATGGGIQTNSGTVSLQNTIVSDSLGGNCAGAVTSAGHNLDSGTTCGLGAIGDLSGVNALLGPLAANGGTTDTHALLPGSAAIDTGDDAGCPATDQRGKPRPQGPGCDIGAYELSP